MFSKDLEYSIGQCYKQARESRLKLFKRLKLDWVELKVGDDLGTALTRFFRARSRRFAA